MGFILLVSGFVVYEILSEWPVSKQILTWLPRQIVGALEIAGPMQSFILAVVMFIVFPGLALLTVVAVAKTLSNASFGTISRAFALLLIPTMAGAHLIKAILKTTSRIPYWPYAISEPAGVQTAGKIIDETIMLDKSVPNALYPLISFDAAAILLIVLIFTLLIIHKSLSLRNLSKSVKAVLLLGVLAYWSIFGLTILKWRF